VRKLPRLSWARVALLVSAVVVGYSIFSTADGVFLSQRLNSDEQRIQQELADLELQRAQLERVREYLQTDEYIEGMARRVLGLVRKGETLVVVNSTAPPTPTPEGQSDAEQGAWWEALYGP